MLGRRAGGRPHVEAQPFTTSPPSEAERDGDLDIAEVGKTRGCRGKPTAAAGTRTIASAARASPAAGTAASWRRSSIASTSCGEFSDTELEQPHRGRDLSPKKTDGWFLHAITGEEWLLKLKFRVAKNTFKRDELVDAARAQAAQRMPDLPVYGNEPRVKCKNLRGPWQEVQLHVHSLDRDRHARVLEVPGRRGRRLRQVHQRVRQNPEDVMPWKVLGQKWHFARKGFPPGKPPEWDIDVLEELCELLNEAAADGQFLWNNQQLVHIFVPQQHEPWATIYTKRAAAIDLVLDWPKGQFALGRVTKIWAPSASFKAGPERDRSTATSHDRGSGSGRPASVPDRTPGQHCRQRNRETSAGAASRLSDLELLLPTRFLFRFAAPLSVRADARREGAQRNLQPRATACRRWANSKGNEPFADVRAAWSEAGLAFSVRLEGKKHPSWCRETKLEDSDALQVWIDTRDTHNIHRASRFCHRFVFLPGGGGTQLRSAGRRSAAGRSRTGERQSGAAGACCKIDQRKACERLCDVGIHSGRGADRLQSGRSPAAGLHLFRLRPRAGPAVFQLRQRVSLRIRPSLWGTLELVK